MIHIDPSAVAIRDAFVMHRNVLAEGALSASSAAADGAAANALGPQTYDFWTPTAVPATLAVTLASAVECDCAAIIAHNLGSKGATVEVQRHNGSTWISVQSVTPEDDSDIFMLFEGVEASQWRIRVTGAVASIGVAMIGPRLLIPKGALPDYVPIYRALNVELMTSVTLGGQYVGSRRRRTSAGASIQLYQQELDWVEVEFDPFIEHFNAGLPFVWASCPDDLPRDAAYCWRAGPTIQPSLSFGARFVAISMEVSAYVGG